MTDRAKIIDYYFQRINNKDFEISEVRRDLEKNNYDEDEIRIIVKLVDNELQRRNLLYTNNRKANDLIYIGGTVTMIGIIITVGTYTGLIEMGNSFLIVYGPFFGGLSILLTGLAKRQR
jgi:hypothetical protein